MQLKSIVTPHKYTLMSNGDDLNAFFFINFYFYTKNFVLLIRVLRIKTQNAYILSIL